MKFLVTIVLGIVSIQAVTLKDSDSPYGENYRQQDSPRPADYDEGNKIDSLFPKAFGTVPRWENEWSSTGSTGQSLIATSFGLNWGKV